MAFVDCHNCESPGGMARREVRGVEIPEGWTALVMDHPDRTATVWRLCPACADALWQARTSSGEPAQDHDGDGGPEDYGEEGDEEAA